MSKPPIQPKRVVVRRITDPVELAALGEERRKYKQTALGQMGCCLVDEAPLPLLAQYIVELAPEERQVFLNELVARLPADAVQPLIDALRARLDAPAA
jgi:hypothetical protein